MYKVHMYYVCMQKMCQRTLIPYELFLSYTAPKMFGSEPNVRVRSGPEPEPPFGFRLDGLAEPNLEHFVRFGFEPCS